MLLNTSLVKSTLRWHLRPMSASTLTLILSRRGRGILCEIMRLTTVTPAGKRAQKSYNQAFRADHERIIRKSHKPITKRLSPI